MKFEVERVAADRLRQLANDVLHLSATAVRFREDRWSLSNWGDQLALHPGWVEASKELIAVLESSEDPHPDAFREAREEVTLAEEDAASIFLGATGLRLRSRVKELDRALQPYAPRLAELRGARQQYGNWSGESACAVLVGAATEILASLERCTDDFNVRGVDWEKLGSDVLWEIGVLRAGLGSERKPMMARSPEKQARGRKNVALEDLPPAVREAVEKARALRSVAVDQCPVVASDPASQEELDDVVQAALRWSRSIMDLYGSADPNSGYRDGLLRCFRGVPGSTTRPLVLASSFLGVPPDDLLEVAILYPRRAGPKCQRMVADEGGLREIPLRLDAWPRIQGVLGMKIPVIQDQCARLVKWVFSRIQDVYGYVDPDREAPPARKVRKKRQGTWDEHARLLLIQELDDGNVDCLGWKICEWALKLGCDYRELGPRRAPNFRRELAERKDEKRRLRRGGTGR